MNCIKATFLPSLAPLEHASAIAIKTIDGTREEVMSILLAKRRKWRRSLIKLRGSAFLKGLESGHLAARLELAAKSEELNAAFRDRLKEAEAQCVELALKVAESVIKESFESSKDLVTSRVRSLLTKCVKRDPFLVVAHPKDVNLIKEGFPGERLNISSSDKLERGDVAIETTSGTIHLSWKRALKAIKEDLL